MEIEETTIHSYRKMHQRVTFGSKVEERLMLVVEPDYLPDSEVLVFSRVYTP
jgi:hypothetical protein